MEDRFKFRFWDKDLKAYMRCVNLDKVFDDKTVIVEQCTGLKDKNGKLIYEGDIVSAITFVGHNRQFIVKYAEEDACFGLFVSKSMYISFNKVYEDSFEVIGNIHKNPELLEADNAR